MPLILASNSASGGYNVANSLRFDSASSDYLNITFSTATNRKIFTFSTWFKKTKNGDYFNLFSAAHATLNAQNWLGFSAASYDDLYFNEFDGASYNFRMTTTQLFRDVSAFYHLVVAVDTTQATASNRIKIYVNGTQVTSFVHETYPSQNYEMKMNSAVNHAIGTGLYNASPLYYFNGYTSETYFIDGQALTPSSFGETDPSVPSSGIWIPKAYTGSFGTNGFYLKFGNSAALGTDSSGNGNNFTVNNLTSVDQSTDTCTNNFATMNSLRQPTGNPATLTNGNLTIATQNTGYYGGRSTISVSSGKWYFEAKLVSETASNIGFIGIQNADSYTPEMFNSSSGAFAGYSSTGYSYNGSGVITNNNADTAYGNSYTTNDIISVALDLDNSKLYFAKNGTFQNSGVPTSGATGTGAISITSGLTYLFAVDDGNNAQSVVWDCNFGSPPFTISSGNSDAEGFGNFEYAVPSGYFALCTKNLADYG